MLIATGVIRFVKDGTQVDFLNCQHYFIGGIFIKKEFTQHDIGHGIIKYIGPNSACHCLAIMFFCNDMYDMVVYILLGG